LSYTRLKKLLKTYSGNYILKNKVCQVLSIKNFLII